jgi:hypothetical protein
MTSASTPPTMKNPNEVVMYSVPIVLRSVVVSQLTTSRQGATGP